MIGYSDDAKIMELLAPLRRLDPLPFVVSKPSVQPWSRRPVLVAAVLVVALALTGVAIANGVGAFDGIGGAQHPRTRADVLDAKTRAQIKEACPSDVARAAFYMPFCHLVLDSARLLGRIRSYGKVYVVADTRGDLCTVIEGSVAGCGSPLSKSHPTTFTAFNPTPTTGGTFVATGIAIDGVTSVSFTVWGKHVSVPVKNNVWVYEKPHSTAHDARCIVVHLADGSTVNPFPEACP